MPQRNGNVDVRLPLWAVMVGGVVLVVAIAVYKGMQRVPTLAAAGDRLAGDRLAGTSDSVANPDHVRLGTFNIDGGVGLDGRLDLSRIVHDMAGCDLVGLQEVHGRTWAEPRDQAAILGMLSQQNWLFAPAERQWWRDAFGNGVICRLPCNHWERLPITGEAATNHRCLLRIDVPLRDVTLHLLIVHLPTTNDRPSQCAIVRSMFLDLAEPVVLLGDLNCKPGDAWIEALRHAAGVVDGVGMFAERMQPAHVDWILARGLICTDGGAIDHGGSDHAFFWNEFYRMSLVTH